MKKLVIAALISLPLISYSQINEFGWLLGTWKVRNKEAYEVWKETSDKKLMEAISFRIKGSDTVLMERIMIRREGEVFLYAPDVADQPEVLFKITKFDHTGFTAENLKHDFPMIIRYQLVSSTSLKTQIGGDSEFVPFDKIRP